MTDKRKNDTPCMFYDEMTPEGMVSVSQINTFLACRRRWHYSYREGLRQRRERDYLTVGKLCHAGMEAAMKLRWLAEQIGGDGHSECEATMDGMVKAGESAIQAMWDDYMAVTDFLDEELPEQRELLARALDVFDEALEEFDPLRWLPITVVRDGEPIPALELHFVVPCAGSEGLHGYIDAILADQETGQVWCVDYKFRRTLASDDERFNLQNAVYMMACRQMGIDVAGTITWQRYNTPSAVPKFNKDGSVSKSKIKCTWTRFRRFLEEAGLDPADYEDMEEKLADVEMCRATREIRSDDMIDLVWDQIVESASTEIGLIYEGLSHILCTPSMDPWTCRLCSFQSLCQAELRGYDADYIRETEYTLRDHRK